VWLTFAGLMPFVGAKSCAPRLSASVLTPAKAKLAARIGGWASRCCPTSGGGGQASSIALGRLIELNG